LDNTELAGVNGTLYFSALRRTSGDPVRGIWKSDGTAAGTTLVKEIEPGVGGESPRYQLMGVNNTLYFVARESATGMEVWKSDGSPAGTTILKDINPVPADSWPGDLTDVNGTLFFGASGQ